MEIRTPDSRPSVSLPDAIPLNIYRALWLHERGTPDSPDSPDERGGDRSVDVVLDYVNHHLRANPTVLAAKLKSEGFTAGELASLLNESAESLQARMHAAAWWIGDIIDNRTTLDNRIPVQLRSVSAKDPGFAQLAGGLLDSAVDRFTERTRPLAGRLGAPAVRESMVDDLRRVIGTLIVPMVITEVHVASLRNQVHGTTGLERVNSVLSNWIPRPPELLLSEYPLLARRIVETARLWVDSAVECLSALVSDRPALARAGMVDIHDEVTHVSWALGDPHRGLRTVRRIRFASGISVVFKPRCLDLDVYFQRVVTDLNESGLRYPLPSMRICSSGSHGWQEYVEHRFCVDREQLRRFYTRQGYYLALLTALNANDIHNENVIASGELPYIVDLETIVQPRQRRERWDESLMPSAVFTGMLPLRTRVSDGISLDLSSLGARPGQRTLAFNQLLSNDHSEVIIGEREHTTRCPASSPTPDVEHILPTHLNDICDGFSVAYDCIARWASDASPSLLAALPNSPSVRVVLRPTKYYGGLIRNSLHPSVQADALLCERMLDDLWVDADATDPAAEVVSAEKRDIRHLDVPYFTTSIHSTSIWSSSGSEIAEALSLSGASNLARSLSVLSAAHKTREMWLIRACVSTVGKPIRPPRAVRTESVQQGSFREISGKLARAAGKWLQDVGAGQPYWYRRDPHDTVPTIEPADLSFYDGISGVALFLAYLYDATGDDRWRILALACVSRIDRELAAGRHQPHTCGLAGGGGLIFALTHVGAVLDCEAAIGAAFRAVSLYEPSLARTEAMDLLAGLAGWIKGVLPLLDWTGRCDLDQSVRAAGERLLSLLLTAVAPGDRHRQLPSGYAHGAAGIADALGALWGVTHDSRYLTAAMAVLASERQLYRPDLGKWLDVPGQEDAEPISDFWCHGSSGIGYSRLNLYSLLKDDALLEDAALCLSGAAKELPANNHSLCHGDLGNLDFVLEYSRTTGDEALRSECEGLADMVCAIIERDGVVGGVFGSQPVLYPTFMTGMAGIGYGLLRLNRPELPCVLRLEGPTTGQRGRPMSSRVGTIA